MAKKRSLSFHKDIGELDEEDEEVAHQNKKLKTKQFLIRPPTPFPSFTSEPEDDSLDNSRESNVEENNEYECNNIMEEDSGNSEEDDTPKDSPDIEIVDDDPPSDPISEDESCDKEYYSRDSLQSKSSSSTSTTPVNLSDFQMKLSLK